MKKSSQLILYSEAGDAVHCHCHSQNPEFKPQHSMDQEKVCMLIILALKRGTRRREVQDHPQLHTELQISLGYMRPCRKNKQTEIHYTQ